MLAKRYFICSMFALLLLLQLQHTTEAFKLIKFGNVRATHSTAVRTSSSSSSSSTFNVAPALDTGALLKGINNGVSTKLNLFSSLANAVVQLKRNLYQSLQSSIASKWDHPNSINTIFAKPPSTHTFVTKTSVNVGGGGSSDTGKHEGYTY